MADKLFTDSEIHDLTLPFALQLVRDMDSYSESVINAFYGHYTPKMYQRQGGLNHMWKADLNPMPDGYEVVITYSSALFGASHNSDEEVFEGPFLRGYHGGPLAWGHPRNVPKMSPSPWELIEEFFNRYDF